MEQAMLNVTSAVNTAQEHFKPSRVYRFCRVFGILAANELICQSKLLFWTEAICAVGASALWGWIAGGLDLAIFVGAVCALAICISLACAISVALPLPGLPLTLTPDFQHERAQCQLHINTPNIRMAQGVKSLVGGLTCVEKLGLRRVLLSSVLIGSAAMRRGIVKRLNEELGNQGMRWVALDEGVETWRYGDFIYKVTYQFLPWITSLGVHRSPRLARSEGGAYAWGKVYLERIG